MRRIVLAALVLPLLTACSASKDGSGSADDAVASCASDKASKDATQFVRAADMCAQKSKTHAGTVFDPLVKAEWWSSKSSGGIFPSSTIVSGMNHANAVGILPSF